MGSLASDDLCFPQRATSQIQKPNPTTERTQRQAGPNFFKDEENVQFMRAEAALDYDFRHEDNTLRVKVKSGQYINRTAQTHDSVMHQFIDVPESPGVLHFEIYFFTEDIFRVKFAGQASYFQNVSDEPEFPPSGARMLVGKRMDVAVQFEANEDFIQLSSNTVQVRVQKKPFQILAYRSGQAFPFWKQRTSDLFTSDVIPTSIALHQDRRAVFEAFTLDPDEALYGLGERFDAVSRRGRPVDFVNHDAIGTSNTRSYINVPFFWSTNGYGCFVNMYARTEWDMGMAEAGTVGFCAEEEYLDYFIISGTTPKDVLTQYTKYLTGIAPLPPVWTFGLWLSRNSYQSWEVVEEILAKCKANRIPVDDIHLDTSWFKEDWNPDLIFDTVRFANHEAKMAKLKEQGVHVSLWQYTFAPPRQDNSLYLEGVEGGFFGKEKLPDGSPGPNLFSYPPGSSGWKLDDAVIDFSNPEVRTWYSKKISSLIQQGASAIKTDFGDCIPPDAYYANIEGRRFQNLYSLVYNATVNSAIKSVDEHTAIWSRSGTAGSQRYPVHWGGDSQCSWSGLQGSLRATLSIGLSGFAFFSHDIGGFIGRPDAELYIRWAQLGLLGASHSRTHGAGDENAREPWAFGDEALGIFRKFVNLRYMLLPYIVAQSRRGAENGLPLIRHLMLEWPMDRNVWTIETQYMLGESIMVLYFPEGTWFDFWTKKKFLQSRGEWKAVELPTLDAMAMWVREGAMICWAKDGRDRTWGIAGEVVKVELYGERLGGGTEGVWICKDGDVGDILVTLGHDGKWTSSGKPHVQVLNYGD